MFATGKSNHKLRDNLRKGNRLLNRTTRLHAVIQKA